MGKNLLLWLIIAAVLLPVFNNFNPQPNSQELSYSQFVEQAQRDQVSAVSMDDVSIRGTLRNGTEGGTFSLDAVVSLRYGNMEDGVSTADATVDADGHYVFEDIPFTGLQLLVGEQPDDTNFLFAIVFTYINGQPVWVVGNTGGEAPGFPQVELEMLRLSGGGFFGQGPGVFTESDVLIEPVGTLFLDPLDCDNVLVGYDFTPINGGIGTLLGSRFIDIAGYDCNPWQ